MRSRGGRTARSSLLFKKELVTCNWFVSEEKSGNCTLILYKTNGQRAVLNVYYAPTCTSMIRARSSCCSIMASTPNLLKEVDSYLRGGGYPLGATNNKGKKIKSDQEKS